MPSAPYVVGQWVRGERFYGRGALVDEILHGPRGWIWLLGTRRIGKTSLLKQLELLTSCPESPYFPLFWDFQGADDADELHRAFREALLDAEERLEGVGIKAGQVEGADLFDSLSLLRRRLRGSKRLLLLCDEVEELLKLNRNDPPLLRKLRRAMQSPEEIRSVLASTIRLWELADQRGDTSPFLHGFAPPLYIRRLDDEDARDLVRQTNLPRDSRPRIDEAAVETIRLRCDNHPYLLQLLAKRCLELGDVEEACEQVATDSMVSYFFAVDFGMLSSTEQKIIHVIGTSTSAGSATLQQQLAIASDEVAGALNRLESLGYVRRNAERHFELVNPFFRRWFREQPGQRRADRARATATVDDDTTETIQSDQGDTTLFDGRYRLLEELGRGAFAIVYRARDEVLQDTIAIKVFKAGMHESTDMLERLRNEILLGRDIGHPNVLRVYHLGDWCGQRYLTMRWVAGTTLQREIARLGVLPIPRVVEIGVKLASALEAAHARGVLHRDVKPQNILLDTEGEPYLVDFGLARLMGSPGVTAQGLFVGTPDYASPEQANLLPLDERSDLYALGVVLFEMTAGRRPFVAETVEGILEQHRRAPPPDPRRLRPETPRQLASVILGCLEKDPALRFPSADALRKALEGVSQDRP